MSSIALKTTSLIIRTLSKPIANYIKAQAREHPAFRKRCVSIAQRLHQWDMRLRLGLLQDQAAIDRQIAREAKEAQLKKHKIEVPTVKTEVQTKADEAATTKEKEKGSDKAQPILQAKPKIRPLSEAKAIDSGATFISEGFLFGVTLSTILFETWRSRRKENNRREDVAEKLRNLEEQDQAKWQLLDELQREVEELRTTAKDKPLPSNRSVAIEEDSSTATIKPSQPKAILAKSETTTSHSNSHAAA
ncbi:hypothetical protein MMC17_001240 [Xylographa soralifera]|nr:hypothetical protein [Xylographa soralifera]